MSQKDTDLVTAYWPMEGFYPAGSKSRAGLLRALVDFPGDLTYLREGRERKDYDTTGLGNVLILVKPAVRNDLSLRLDIKIALAL